MKIVSRPRLTAKWRQALEEDALSGACPKTPILDSLSAAFVVNFVETRLFSATIRQSLRQRLPTKLILGEALIAGSLLLLMMEKE